MPSYICPHCSAHNSEAGQCVLCYKNIGSWREAMKAGFYTAVILGVLWVAATAIFKIQLPMLAVGFGAAVALSVSHFSGGKGFLYQAIATGFTAAGIICADSVSMLVVAYREGQIELQQVTLNLLWADMTHRATEDAATILYYFLGIIGSFCIWR